MAFQVEVGPWPWSLLNVITIVLFVAAICTAWKSADGVLAKNRSRTRAWRLVQCCIAFSVGGVWVPVGAIYVLYRYHAESLKSLIDALPVRFKLYSELTALAGMGAMLGYSLATGQWWATLVTISAFTGSCQFMARKYLRSDDIVDDASPESFSSSSRLPDRG